MMELSGISLETILIYVFTSISALLLIAVVVCKLHSICFPRLRDDVKVLEFSIAKGTNKSDNL